MEFSAVEMVEHMTARKFPLQWSRQALRSFGPPARPRVVPQIMQHLVPIPIELIDVGLMRLPPPSKHDRLDALLQARLEQCPPVGVEASDKRDGLLILRRCCGPGPVIFWVGGHGHPHNPIVVGPQMFRVGQLRDGEQSKSGAVRITRYH